MNCFYFPQLINSNRIIDLQGDEMRHIAGARRLKVGDKLLLFNGKGLVANAVITSIMKLKLSVRVTQITQLTPPLPRIAVATAIPKGDRVSTLLDMCTQLGMSDLIPLMSERSVVEVNTKKYERFSRICINACKQSRRFFVPKIHLPKTVSGLLEHYKDSDSLIMVADPGGRCLRPNELFKRARNLVTLVGPEGGFSESESGLLAENGIVKIKLTDAILRTETACISLLSQINCRQMD